MDQGIRTQSSFNKLEFTHLHTSITPEIVIDMITKTSMTFVKLKSPEIISMKCTRNHIHDYHVSGLVGCVTAGTQLICPTCKCKSQFPNAVRMAADKLTGNSFQLDHDIGITGESPRDIKLICTAYNIDEGKKPVVIICRKGVGPAAVSCQDPLTITLHPMSASKIPSILRAYFVEYGVLSSSPPKIIKKTNSHVITRSITRQNFDDNYIEDMQLKSSSEEFVSAVVHNAYDDIF